VSYLAPTVLFSPLWCVLAFLSADARSLVSSRERSEESHPPAIVYQFNRDHVASDALAALAELRERLLSRMRFDIAGWNPTATSVLLYGSLARGEGTADSDVDVLVIRPRAVHFDDTAWRLQLEQFVHRVQTWSGNGCEILELSPEEFVTAVSRGRRLERELRKDAICIGGQMPESLLAKAARS